MLPLFFGFFSVSIISFVSSLVCLKIDKAQFYKYYFLFTDSIRYPQITLTRSWPTIIQTLRPHWRLGTNAGFTHSALAVGGRIRENGVVLSLIDISLSKIQTNEWMEKQIGNGFQPYSSFSELSLQILCGSCVM